MTRISLFFNETSAIVINLYHNKLYAQLCLLERVVTSKKIYIEYNLTCYNIFNNLRLKLPRYVQMLCLSFYFHMYI